VRSRQLALQSDGGLIAPVDDAGLRVARFVFAALN
jgi:hypothetical protein